MNKETISQLYRLNVELEGILRVLEERDTPAARQLLGEKFNLYHNAMQQLLSDCETAHNGVGEAAVAETLNQGASQLLQQAHGVEVKDQEAVETEVEPEMDAAVDAIERGQHAQQPEEQPEIEAIEATIAEQPVQPMPAAAPEQPVQIPTPISVPEQPKMKVDEMIQRRESADLRRVFTLNDKFRFRRELFGNDEQAFRQAIDTLDGMNTYGQAEAYLMGQLGLDEGNETVRDFITVIQRHFGV